MSEVRLETPRLVWLQSFLAFVECGGQAGASAKLRRKQPQISTDIKQLEKWLGTPLLQTPARRALTPAGTDFMPVAEEVLRLMLDSRSPAATETKSPALAWLMAFLKVAECGTQGEAARQLGWTQSSVSRYLEHLEIWLGKKLVTLRAGLIDPLAAPPVLTLDGRALVPVATSILRLMNASRSTEAAQRPNQPVLVHQKSDDTLIYNVYFEMRQLLDRGMVQRTGRKYSTARKIYQELHAQYHERYENDPKRWKMKGRRSRSSFLAEKRDKDKSHAHREGGKGVLIGNPQDREVD